MLKQPRKLKRRCSGGAGVSGTGGGGGGAGNKLPSSTGGQGGSGSGIVVRYIKSEQYHQRKQLVVLLVSMVEKPFIFLLNLEHLLQMRDLMKL